MVVIRKAEIRDLPGIARLLDADGLRTEGVLEEATRYWVAADGDRAIGAIGLELGRACVLLRSAIVARDHRGRGIGRALTDHALAWAWAKGYDAAYCFSTDAGEYWTARGFRQCPVDEVVSAMPDAPQVRLFDDLGWLPTEVAYRIAPEPARA